MIFPQSRGIRRAMPSDQNLIVGKMVQFKVPIFWVEVQNPSPDGVVRENGKFHSTKNLFRALNL